MLELWYFTWTFPVISVGTLIIDPVTLTLEFDPLFENFNLAFKFRTVSTRALIFHMTIPCDKTSTWVPLFLYPVTLTLDLTHVLKTLTLLITFELWMLDLWYFTGVFLVIRSFRGYHYFLPCYLGLGEWPFFENVNLSYNLCTMSARAFVFHMSIPCDKTFTWVP